MKQALPEDLTTIVRNGASRPFRKWIIISILCALTGAGVYYYMTRDDSE